MRSPRFWIVTGLVSLCATLHCGGSDSTFGDGNDQDAGGPGSSGSSGLGQGDGGFPGSGSSSSGPGSSGIPACATAESSATRDPVYLDIVLDGSRSMDGHGRQEFGCDDRNTQYQAQDGSYTCFLAGSRETDPLAPQREAGICHIEGNAASTCTVFRGLTGKKWLAIRGALGAFFEAQAELASPRLGVAMYLFESTVKKPANAWDVPLASIDTAHAAALWGRIAPGTWPSGGTPLRASIDGQAALLRAFEPAAPLEAGGKRAILLVTDGVPNGSSTDAAVVESVRAARSGTPEVLTAVIGVGDTSAPNNVYNETFLSTLAAEGGAARAGCNPDWDGQQPNGTTACHVQITPGEKTAAQLQAELTAAIDAIALQLQSCELTLDRTSPIDPSKVNVVLVDGAGNETQLPADADNGWTYDDPADPSKVILNGSACGDLKADPAAKVTIVVGCPTGTEVR